MMVEESHDGFGIGSEAGVEVLGNGYFRAGTVDHLTTDPKVKEPGLGLNPPHRSFDVENWTT
jgi:hypothetical protein